LWRFWYDSLASKDRAGELLFMNYGYDADEHSLPLLPADEPFRYSIQLYAHVTKGINIAAKDVLEIGCGRGGGGSFIVRYHHPNSYTGVDLSETAIAWCQSKLNLPATQWIHGRADSLPMPNNSVDLVINVESSHTYPSMPLFLREVQRVLRPGGYFAFCDVRMAEQIPELEQQFAESGLDRINLHFITRNVLRALDGITAVREQQILTKVPRLFRAAFRDFAGIKDSILHRMMAADKLQYVSCLLQKPADT